MRALALLSSLGDGEHRALEVIPGQPPQVGAQIDGCRFADRCPHVTAVCRSGPIELRRLAGERAARCVLADAQVREPVGVA